MNDYYLVVNHERLLGFFRDPRKAATLAARFSFARVVALARDADRDAVYRVVGDNEPIARHVLGKLAMIAYRDPRAFGMTDWAYANLRKR